ncbi:MAG: response regulator [Ilumatobacteraceae bacterium]
MTGTTAVLAARFNRTGADQRAGDADLHTDALATVRFEVERHNGTAAVARDEELRTMFDSATDAVAAAVAIQEELHAHHPRVAGPRIGIEVGEVRDDDPDRAVAIGERARTLARAAHPGQILTTNLVRNLAHHRADVEFETIGDLGVDGGEHLSNVVAVAWTPRDRDATMSVAVADDAALIRSGLVQLLTAAGFTVTAEAADADQLIEAVEQAPPDLVVTDIRMPPTNTDEGLRAAAEIRSAHPEVAVLVLSQHIEARAAAALLDGRPAGIGYLLKERISDINEFVDACTTIAEGGSVIDPIVAERLVGTARDDLLLDRLSERERDVLTLMAHGKSNQAIASGLYVGSKTVESHVRSIFQKLELAGTPEGNRRVQAVLHWLQSGRTLRTDP